MEWTSLPVPDIRAITDIVYDEFFSEPIGELVINELPLKLIIVTVPRVEIVQWIK